MKQSNTNRRGGNTNIKARTWPTWVLALIALIGVGAGVYFYQRYTDIRDNPTSVIENRNTADSERVISKLRSLILVGDGEPTIARIEDPARLLDRNPDFYADAQSGDYLVLYPDRAIIYRESINQIINIAPIINTSQIEAESSDEN